MKKLLVYKKSGDCGENIHQTTEESPLSPRIEINSVLKDMDKILLWLKVIGEDNREIIDEVLMFSRKEPWRKEYFLSRADEIFKFR